MENMKALIDAEAPRRLEVKKDILKGTSWLEKAVNPSL